MMKNPLSITRLTIILGAVAMAGCTPSMSDPASIEPVASSAGFSQTEEAEIKQSYMRNAVRSTLHRTWHYYENDQASADVLFDLLDEEVVISTPAGTFDGRGAFEAFVADLQINHANGHRLRSVEINPQSDGLIGLNAEVEYVAIGASEDGEAGSTLTPLYYSGTMNLDPISGLAKIMALKIELGQSGPSSAYPDAYVNNRLLSLAHHFHAMIENPNRSAETFDEVLAEEFSLSFPGQEIDDPEAFAAWIESISPILQASEHDHRGRLPHPPPARRRKLRRRMGSRARSGRQTA